MSKSANTPEIFCWKKFEEFTDGDPELEQSFISLYIKNLDDDLQNMDQAYKTKDHKEWCSWAHKLHGVCSHIGAYEIAQSFNKAQTMNTGSEDQVAEIHQNILSQYKSLRKTLEKKSGS